MNKNEIAEIISDKLNENRDELKESYNRVIGDITTRFFVLDNLLPEDLVLRLYKSFPDLEDYSFCNNFRERKLTLSNLDNLTSKLINEVTDCFQDIRVIKAVSAIVDIPHLEADPFLLSLIHI